MRKFSTFLLLAVFLITAPGYGASLRDQLTAAHRDGDVYAEIELMRRILEKESDPDLQKQLITLWVRVGDSDMAESALANWESAPASFQALVRARILMDRDHDPAAALAILMAQHGKEPGNRELTAALVEVMSSQGDNPGIDALLSALPGVDGDAEFLLQRAGARRALGNFSAALEDFSAADQIDSKISKDQRPAFERLQAALPELQAASATLSENPDDFLALITRGALYREVGVDQERQEADARAALNLVPGSSAARLLLAGILPSSDPERKKLGVDTNRPVPSKDSLLALAKLDLGLAANPKDIEVLVARSYALNDSPSQFRLGLGDAEAALALSSSSAEAHLEKIYALTKLNQLSDAAVAFKEMKAVKVPKSKLAKACDYLAENELAAYRLNPALEYASLAIATDPSAKRYKTRAAVLQRLGRASDAREDLARAKELEEKS